MRRDVGFLPWLWRGLLVAVATALCLVPGVAMAADVGDTYTITYKTDAGHFSNGTDTNVVGYTVTGKQNVTKHSHTSNIDDDGNATGTYASNLSTTDVVTIPGAKSLTIDVWYSTESTSYDWLAIYPASGTPSQGNSSQASVSGGKLGGGYAKTRDGATHVTYTVDGDTAQFYFRSDGYGNYYGYYAVVTGISLTSAVTSGSYEEPTGLPDGYKWHGWYSDEAHALSVDPSSLTSDATVYGYTSPYDHEGTCGTVNWGIKPSGELHFWPTNGTEGTLASNTQYRYDFWPWYQYRSSVKSITSEGTIHATGSLYQAFSGCSNLANVDGLASWDTSKVTNMSDAFSYCSSLANVDGLASWDTSKVTTMGSMFYNCSSLTSLDGLASWDTSSVTTMGRMFYNCSSLTSLDGLASWDTSSVTSMGGMFYNCSSLTSLEALANWDTSKVIYLDEAFRGCSGLTDISALASWNTSKVGRIEFIFSGCSSLASISALGGWNTSSLGGDLNGAFENCLSLTNLDGLANWDTSRVNNLEGTFKGCSSLANADGVSDWDVSSVTDFQATFENCSSLTAFSMENWDTSKSQMASGMFTGCSNLSSVTLGPKVTADVAGWLPAPPVTSPYTGKWVREDGSYGPYYAWQLKNSWNGQTMFGTWVWETVSYTVSFDANGGIGSMASVKASPDITVPVSYFRYVGREFVGWNTKADGSGQTLIVGASYTPTANVTLYAQWKEMPNSVSGSEFDVTTHGNEQVTIEGLPAGATYEVTETPVPSGWTLVRQQDTTGVIAPGVS